MRYINNYFIVAKSVGKLTMALARLSYIPNNISYVLNIICFLKDTILGVNFAN